MIANAHSPAVTALPLVCTVVESDGSEWKHAVALFRSLLRRGAHRDYGVVIRGRGRKRRVDDKTTAALRSEFRTRRSNSLHLACGEGEEAET